MPNLQEIKVLFVTHYRELYGANNSLLQLILELREKGVVPSVLMPDYEIKPGNDLGLELDKYGIHHLNAKIRFDKNLDAKKAVVSYIRTLFYRQEVAKVVVGQHFDIIHSNSGTISTGAYLAKKFGKPHVWHLREFGDLDYGFKTPFGKWFQKFIYKGENTFIAISNSIKNHYRTWIGNQDIKVIYNGIKPSLKRQPYKHDRIEICIVGHIRPNKGQMELIEAIDDLVNHRNIRNLHVSLIGSSEKDYEEKIKAFIRNHELAQYINLTGRRNDVSEMLTKMDIGVMASPNEAFGRATVEYMMAGLAVVASDGGANKEIIQDGKTGLIYKSGNSKSLADKLEILIKNSDILEKLAENGQTAAEKNFSSAANSNAIYNIYEEILEK